MPAPSAPYAPLNRPAKLADALVAAQAGTDYPLIQTRSSSAISAANNLASAITNNGDNVLKESLAAAANAYFAAQTTFATVSPISTWALVVCSTVKPLELVSM